MAAMVSLLPNHRSTLISFPPAADWISRDMCLKDLWRVPLGPFTVTSLDLKLTVTEGEIKNEGNDLLSIFRGNLKYRDTDKSFDVMRY